MSIGLLCAVSMIPNLRVPVLPCNSSQNCISHPISRGRWNQHSTMSSIGKSTMRKATLLIACGVLLGGHRPKHCPSDMVAVTDRICIDRFEWPNIEGEKPLLGVSAIAETEDVLAGLVMDGAQLCATVNKRLCYEDEWINACRGPDGAPFPFGNTVPDFVPGDGSGLCNYDKLFRKVDENKVFRREPKEMRRLDQSEPAGHREHCVSATGAVDMMGSAEEWVLTRDGGYALAGRYWAQPWACHSLAREHAPNWHYYQSGFRCCLDLGE